MINNWYYIIFACEPPAAKHNLAVVSYTMIQVDTSPGVSRHQFYAAQSKTIQPTNCARVSRYGGIWCRTRDMQSLTRSIRDGLVLLARGVVSNLPAGQTSTTSC